MEQGQLKWHTWGMKTIEIIVIIHFLERLRKQTENEQLYSPLSRGFEYLLSKEELIQIINHMYDGRGSDEYGNLEGKSSQELLNIIDDEYYILCYFIEEVLGKYTL